MENADQPPFRVSSANGLSIHGVADLEKWEVMLLLSDSSCFWYIFGIVRLPLMCLVPGRIIKQRKA